MLENTKTKDLLKDWKREDVLRLSMPLEGRFDIRLASPDTFKQMLGQLLAQDAKGYRMRALVVVGRDDADAVAAGKAIDAALVDPRSANVVFVDATKETLDDGSFDKWAEYKARANWFARKDQQQSNNALSEAEKVLVAWRDRIAEGQFTVRTKRNPSGTVCHGAPEVCEEMRLSVLERYPFALEFSPGIVDTLFNAATKGEVSAGAWGGLGHLPQGEKGGKMNEKSETAVLGVAKDTPDYWKEAATQGLPISKIKAKLEQKLRAAFKSGGEGRMAMSDIVETLFDNGFMPTALHGFLTGFLLKEYVGRDYRFGRDDESVPLTVANLTTGILDCFKNITGHLGGRYHESFIEVLTAEQKRFADLAKTVFGLGKNASLDIVAQQLAARVRDFQYPLWCFKALPEAASAERYIDLFTTLLNPANQKGATLSGLATDIGHLAAAEADAEGKLSALFTKEKAREAMNAWLDEFEDGAFRQVAREINAPDPLADVRRCFDAGGSGAGVWLWHPETGEKEIRNLLRDYRIVSESFKRGFLAAPTSSFFECMESWRDKARTVRIPYATLVTLRPQSKAFLGFLKEIAGGGRLEQNDRRDAFYREITANGDLNRDMLDGCRSLFKATYAEQLSGLDDEEMDALYLKGLDMSAFLQDKPTYEQVLAAKVTEVKSHQSRAKLLALWQEKTCTDSPADWSKRHGTPILAMTPGGTPLLDGLRKALDAVNDKTAPVAKVDAALEFFRLHPEVFEWFDGTKADDAFRVRVMGRYAAVLTDLGDTRVSLEKKLGDSVYAWFGDPRLDSELRKLAEREYNLHCADRIRDKIKAMGADEAKGYLVDLVANSLDVGLTILAEE